MFTKLHSLFLSLICSLSSLTSRWEREAEEVERRKVYVEKHPEIKELK